MEENVGAHMLSVVAVRLSPPLVVQEPFHTVLQSFSSHAGSGAFSLSVKIRNPCNAFEHVVLESGSVIGTAIVVAKPKTATKKFLVEGNQAPIVKVVGEKAEAPKSFGASSIQTTSLPLQNEREFSSDHPTQEESNGEDLETSVVDPEEAEKTEDLSSTSSRQMCESSTEQTDECASKSKQGQGKEKGKEELNLCTCDLVIPGKLCPECPSYKMKVLNPSQQSVIASTGSKYKPVVFELSVRGNSDSPLNIEGIDTDRILVNPQSYGGAADDQCDAHLFPGCLWKLERGENRFFAAGKVGQWGPRLSSDDLLSVLKKGEVFGRCQLVECHSPSRYPENSPSLAVTIKSIGLKEDALLFAQKKYNGHLVPRYFNNLNTLKPSDLVHVHIPLSENSTLFPHKNCFQWTKLFWVKGRLHQMLGVLKQSETVKNAETHGEITIVRENNYILDSD